MAGDHIAEVLLGLGIDPQDWQRVTAQLRELGDTKLTIGAGATNNLAAELAAVRRETASLSEQSGRALNQQTRAAKTLTAEYNATTAALRAQSQQSRLTAQLAAQSRQAEERATRDVVGALSNQVAAYRNLRAAGQITNDQLVAQQIRIQNEALQTMRGLDQQSDAYRRLSLVAAQAQRAIDHTQGVNTFGGLAASVQQALTQALGTLGPFGQLLEAGLNARFAAAAQAATKGAEGVGESIAEGMGEGLNARVGAIRDNAESAAAAAIDATKEKLQIQSPSKEFHEIGELTVQGFIDGIESQKEKAAAAARQMAENSAREARGAAVGGPGGAVSTAGGAAAGGALSGAGAGGAGSAAANLAATGAAANVGARGLAAFGGAAAVATAGVVALVASGAAVGAVLVEGADKAIEFEAGLARIATITDKTTAELGEVGDAILKMSVQTGQSFQELQAGMADVLGADVKGTQNMTAALDLLRVAADAAVAGYTDTATATDVLTSALNAYGLDASEAARVSDDLFLAVKDGKVEFDDLAAGLGKVMPIAAQTGVSLEELLAGVAALTASGLEAPAAMDGLRSALSNVIKPSEQARDLADDLGLEFDAAALKSKGLARFLGDVIKATGGSADELAILFGDVQGLTSVLSLGGDELGRYNEILTRMGSNAGTTGEALAKANATTEAAQKRWNSALNTFYIAVGQHVLPLFTPLLKGATDVLTVITDLVDGVESVADLKVNPEDNDAVKLVKYMATGFTELKRIVNEIRAEFEQLETWLTNFGKSSGLHALVDLLGQVGTAALAIPQWALTGENPLAPALNSNGVDRLGGPRVPGQTTIAGVPTSRQYLTGQGPLAPGQISATPIGAQFAEAAIEGLTDKSKVSIVDRCSQFIREVFQEAFPKAGRALFGDTAKITEDRFKAAGLTTGKVGKITARDLQVGDVVFNANDQSGAGHVGVYIGNGMIAENSRRNFAKSGGRDARGLTRVEDFGPVTSVGRVDTFGPLAGQGGAVGDKTNTDKNPPRPRSANRLNAMLSDAGLRLELDQITETQAAGKFAAIREEATKLAAAQRQGSIAWREYMQVAVSAQNALEGTAKKTKKNREEYVATAADLKRFGTAALEAAKFEAAIATSTDPAWVARAKRRVADYKAQGDAAKAVLEIVKTTTAAEARERDRLENRLERTEKEAERREKEAATRRARNARESRDQQVREAQQAADQLEAIQQQRLTEAGSNERKRLRVIQETSAGVFAAQVAVAQKQRDAAVRDAQNKGGPNQAAAIRIADKELTAAIAAATRERDNTLAKAREASADVDRKARAAIARTSREQGVREAQQRADALDSAQKQELARVGDNERARLKIIRDNAAKIYEAQLEVARRTRAIALRDADQGPAQNRTAARRIAETTFAAAATDAARQRENALRGAQEAVTAANKKQENSVADLVKRYSDLRTNAQRAVKAGEFDATAAETFRLALVELARDADRLKISTDGQVQAAHRSAVAWRENALVWSDNVKTGKQLARMADEVVKSAAALFGDQGGDTSARQNRRAEALALLSDTLTELQTTAPGAAEAIATTSAALVSLQLSDAEIRRVETLGDTLAASYSAGTLGSSEYLAKLEELVATSEREAEAGGEVANAYTAIAARARSAAEAVGQLIQIRQQSELADLEHRRNLGLISGEEFTGARESLQVQQENTNYAAATQALAARLNAQRITQAEHDEQAAVLAAQHQARLTTITNAGEVARRNAARTHAENMASIEAEGAQQALDLRQAAGTISQREFLEQREALALGAADREYNAAVESGGNIVEAEARRELARTRILAEGARDREALQRIHAETMADIAAERATNDLETRRGLGLVAERDYLAAREQLEIQAAERTRDRELQAAQADFDKQTEAWAKFDAARTSITNRGAVERRSAELRLAREALEAQEQLALVNLEAQHSAQLISDQNASEQREALALASLARRQAEEERAAAGDAQLLATIWDKYEAERVRITSAGVAERSAMERAHAQEMADILAEGEGAALERQFARQLIGEAEYLEQREALELESAERRLAAALEKAGSNEGAALAAWARYENERTAITEKGVDDRARLEREHFDALVEREALRVEAALDIEGREVARLKDNTPERFAREAALQRKREEAQLAAARRLYERELREAGASLSKQEDARAKYETTVARIAAEGVDARIAQQERERLAVLNTIDMWLGAFGVVANTLDKITGGSLSKLAGGLTDAFGAFKAFSSGDIVGGLTGVFNSVEQLGDFITDTFNPGLREWQANMAKIAQSERAALGGSSGAFKNPFKDQLEKDAQNREQLANAGFWKRLGWQVFGGAPQAMSEAAAEALTQTTKIFDTFGAGLTEALNSSLTTAFLKGDMTGWAENFDKTFDAQVGSLVIETMVSAALKTGAIAEDLKALTDAVTSGNFNAIPEIMSRIRSKAQEVGGSIAAAAPTIPGYGSQPDEGRKARDLQDKKPTTGPRELIGDPGGLQTFAVAAPLMDAMNNLATKFDPLVPALQRLADQNDQTSAQAVFASSVAAFGTHVSRFGEYVDRMPAGVSRETPDTGSRTRVWRALD